MKIPCPDCNGMGYLLIDDDPFNCSGPTRKRCATCQGQGEVEKSEKDPPSGGPLPS